MLKRKRIDSLTFDVLDIVVDDDTGIKTTNRAFFAGIDEEFETITFIVSAHSPNSANSANNQQRRRHLQNISFGPSLYECLHSSDPKLWQWPIVDGSLKCQVDELLTGNKLEDDWTTPANGYDLETYQRCSIDAWMAAPEPNTVVLPNNIHNYLCSVITLPIEKRAQLYCIICSFGVQKKDMDCARLAIPLNPDMWIEWKCPACKERDNCPFGTLPLN